MQDIFRTFFIFAAYPVFIGCIGGMIISIIRAMYFEIYVQDSKKSLKNLLAFCFFSSLPSIYLAVTLGKDFAS